MKKAFDLYEALKEQGYEESVTQYGVTSLTKTITKKVEVLWYGVQELQMRVEVYFNQSKTDVTVHYYDGGRRPFKEKCHAADKRAFNAINQTIINKGF